jgi:oxygen-independent coproporphyrinogen-3 oxidase
MKIILTSHSLSRSELAAGLSLARAFFPKGQVQVAEVVNPAAAESPEFKELQGVQEVQETQDVQEVQEAEARILLEISYLPFPGQAKGCFVRNGQKQAEVFLDSEQIKSILAQMKIGKDSDQVILLKHVLYALLAEVTGHKPPWGILTGIRPSKLIQRLKDAKASTEEAEEVLSRRYLIREDKLQLIQEIAAVQEPYLVQMQAHPEQAAVYVGIPFCPTRCSYCSFPAYSLQQGREPLKVYLQGLANEIRQTGKWMRERGLSADSLYLGGGTPTILDVSELMELIGCLKSHIPLAGQDKLASGWEFTVEAGRPDTLSREKLQVLREQGVTRISVNPQTMHDRTLQRIGRSHTVEDIVRIYELAREIPDWVINMDLILGLPGEGLNDVQETLEQIGKLKPDNLTVHSLAIKRGSKECELGLTENLDQETERMQKCVLACARSLGLRPYYLYRQKHIAGNLENIGFAREGAECRYNIGIMEERQSVIGLGAGASSKVVNPRDYSLVNFQHNTNWQVYLQRWPELQDKRVKAWNELRHEKN